ncbi:hypothetical protein K469DRAFT_779473 [Zopfia rhizophila CBS 207.26]|uniref:Zn(2)-C6 fungal-type domain-containing protein n=1 Tax=Zopfia rhizophila CBS 207.26 TaxID=1314779 RepID=A0A6A6E2E1_9PEZI|nr:hypothetical protein K469DRAFT_779473 [Zopfia rhizophila CBS 207.26]
MSPGQTTPAGPLKDKVRKRVKRACDRCRLKKIKCDSIVPCGQCKAYDTICVFGERKKLRERIYTQGYVEVLRREREQLITGVRALYNLLQASHGWPGQLLPSTHDVLDMVGALYPTNNSSGYKGQNLIERGHNFSYSSYENAPRPQPPLLKGPFMCADAPTTLSMATTPLLQSQIAATADQDARHESSTLVPAWADIAGDFIDMSSFG